MNSSYRHVSATKLSGQDLTNIVLCLALTFFCVAPYAFEVLTTQIGESAFPATAAAVSSMIIIVSLLFRYRQPDLALAIATFGALLQALSYPAPTPALVCIPVISYSYAKAVHGRKARLVVIVGALGSPIAGFRWGDIDFQIDIFSYIANAVAVSGICLVLVITPYVFGRRIQQEEDIEVNRQEVIHETYLQQLRASEQRARMSEIKARNDIARELHDIVAHSLSVMIVQAEGGRAFAAKHPDKAVEVLDTIAENGREALGEMRRIVGVLRSDPASPADFSPSPNLSNVASLVEHAGDRITLDVRGRARELPQTIGLTLFRVIQEGITNFLKHAGPEAQAKVTVEYRPNEVLVRVLDNGLGAKVSNDGMGNGLTGMQERVTSMHGRLTATPLPERGFLVEASVPLPAS